uniref:U1-type domain-containing protein n=1 Tax=Manihot esculenta TaxID=3983 RepID=A0A2C9UMW7_MANES
MIIHLVTIVAGLLIMTLRILLQAKSDPNRCGVKRKAPTPPEGGAAGLPYVGLNKKPKEEWSCALCQVSAISERGLNEHLRGKKHKARQARLRASKMAKSPRSVCLSGNSSRSAKLATRNTSSDKKADKNTNDTDKKTGNKLDSGNHNGKLRLQKNVRKKTMNKDRAAKLKRKGSKAELSKPKKFKFWCETCQVGAYSAVVIEAHKKGKKHLFRLLELDQTGEAVSTIMTIASSKAGEKAKDTEVTTGKTNMKIMEDANVNEKITETVADNQKMKGSLIADWDGLGQSSMLIIKTE